MCNDDDSTKEKIEKILQVSGNCNIYNFDMLTDLLFVHKENIIIKHVHCILLV
jgi:hypothetical protein